MKSLKTILGIALSLGGLGTTAAVVGVSAAQEKKAVVDSEVRADASSVKLAGDFTNWATNAIPMTLNGDNYELTTTLKANAEFKIIVNNNDWVGYKGDAAAQGRYSTDQFGATGDGANFRVLIPGNYTFSIPKGIDSYGDKAYGVYITQNSEERYLIGNWDTDEDGTDWEADDMIALTTVSSTHYKVDNVSFSNNAQFKMVYYRSGNLQWPDVSEAWSMDSLSYPVGIEGGNVKVTTAGIYNVDINDNSGWKYGLTPVVSGVADGGYLRGTWTNGWIVSGQKAMTKNSNTSYSIEGVDLSADGQVKIVIYSGGVISWCEFHGVSTTDSTNYPVKILNNNAAVTKSGTYTITVTLDAESGGWDYLFEGTSNPTLEAAVAYATAFNTAIDGVCDVEGGTDFDDLDAVWTAQANAFSAITDTDAKTLLSSDLSSSTVEALSKFAAKYNLVYRLYGTRLTRGNFANRVISGANPNTINQVSNNNTAVVAILITSIVALSAAGMFFILRKKQKN